MDLFPAMAEGRTGSGQAFAQLAAMATTVLLGLAGGLVTGLVMRAAGAFQFRPVQTVCCFVCLNSKLQWRRRHLPSSLKI